MSELNDMTCAELADVAAELALGVLTGRERAVAVAHLDRCDGCREHVRQLMATGDQLLELLPAAEPPAGFETRVLGRLGLSVPAERQTAPDAGDDADGRQPHPPHLPGRTDTPRRWRARGDAAGRGDVLPPVPGPRRRLPGTRPGGSGPDGARPGSARPGATGPGRARPGEGGRPGRMRRFFSAAAIGLAVVVAGLGGWRIGADTATTAAAPASGPLTTASLVSVTHRHVGQVFLYSGTPGWLYMSVDLGSGNGTVTCQVIGKNGQVTTIGSFRLADGYGAWGSPKPGYLGKLGGARLIAPDGSVLASGTFGT